jgi:hypothetical protein
MGCGFLLPTCSEIPTGERHSPGGEIFTAVRIFPHRRRKKRARYSGEESGTEPAFRKPRGTVMKGSERRLIVDRGFDVAMEMVIDAFLREGFTIEPVGAGDLRHRPESGDPLRYAVLEAWLPEAIFARRRTGRTGVPAFGCRIAVYELVGACTLVTAVSPGVDYPTLASVVPDLNDRMGSALKALTPAGASIVAA